MRQRLYYTLDKIDNPFKIIEGDKKDQFRIGTLNFKLDKNHRKYNRLRNIIIEEKKIRKVCWSRKGL